MKIQRSALTDGVAKISLTGEFDAFAANPFLEQVEAVLQSGSLNLVVDLHLVLFINSTAIGSLIKARKRARGMGGELVLSAPSKRVTEALQSLGLDKVIKSFASDDEAVAHFETSEDEAVAVPSENAVLLKFSDADKQARFLQGDKTAKMAALDEDGISFTSKADAALFGEGTEVKVKFRLPLFRRSYYFDVPCKIRSSSGSDEGTTVRADFEEIFEEDQRAIAQFVRDLRLLKEELRSAGEGS